MVIATIAQHLLYKCKPFTKRNVPIPNKRSAHSEEFMLSIPGGHFSNYVVSSENHGIASDV